MIVILEGPDGAGKTTLAEQLQKKFPSLKYHHEGPPPKDIEPLEHYGAVLENIRKTGHDYVIDRLALGERVYGPIYRGRDGLGREGWTVMCRLIEACNCTPVICLPPFEDCHRAWSSGREEMYKGEDQFRQIYASYQMFAADDDVGGIIYNYRVECSFNSLSAVLASEICSKSKAWPAGVVGSRYAQYLLVGERGSNSEALVDLPFWATVNSSKYLTDCLYEAGYAEIEFAMVNAEYLDGSHCYIPTTNMSGEPMTVITLGSTADSRCTQLGIPHHVLPHPQYHKRFHSKDRGQYVELLRKVRT